MYSTNPKRYILQAIEHLRGRKARPDLHQICNMLKKWYYFTFADTKRYIEYLMDMGIVFKVEYKGNFSYRDASMWKKGRVAGHIINSPRLVAKIQTAITAIVSQIESSPDGEDANGGRFDSSNNTDEQGATAEQIENWLKAQKNEEKCLLTGDAVLEVLTREVETQTLRRLSDGTYAVGKGMVPTHSPHRQQSSSPAKSPTAPKVKRTAPLSPAPGAQDSSTDASDAEKRGRPPSKRKRIKKNHGDDFEVLPICKSKKAAHSKTSSETHGSEVSVKKEHDPSPEQSGSIVRFHMCHEEPLSSVPGHYGGQEHELLLCHGCNTKAHPSCIDFSPELVEKIDQQHGSALLVKCAICNVLLTQSETVLF